MHLIDITNEDLENTINKLKMNLEVIVKNSKKKEIIVLNKSDLLKKEE